MCRRIGFGMGFDVALAGVLALGAVSKYSQLSRGVSPSPTLLGHAASPWLLWTAAAVEAGLAVLSAVRGGRRWVGAMLLVVFAGFSAAHVHAVVSGAGRAACNCFGAHVPVNHGVMLLWTSVCLLGCWIRYHRVWTGIEPPPRVERSEGT